MKIEMTIKSYQWTKHVFNAVSIEITIKSCQWTKQVFNAVSNLNIQENYYFIQSKDYYELSDPIQRAIAKYENTQLFY